MTSLLSSQTASQQDTSRTFFALFPLLAICLVFLCPEPVQAELADDYLAELRQRGWHDTVLEYLELAAQDPLVTPAFLEKLDYERAMAQIALARETAGEKQRQALFAEATESLQQFVASKSDSPLKLQALATTANLHTEQALSTTKKAEKLPANAEKQREQLFDSARKFLQQAEPPLQDLLKLCDERLQALPKAAELQKDPTALANRQKLKAKQAEAKFLLAKLTFEKSRTYKADSTGRKNTLADATSAFESVYSEYEEKLVGYLSRLYQGRSLQEAGELEDAMQCYWDIVDQPPIPNQDFRRLVTRAFLHRAECHVIAGDLDKAIEECREWMDESRGSDFKEPDWLALSFQLATIYELKAAQAEGSDAQRLRTEARKLFREVARIPGKFQREAKARMATGGNSKIDKPIVAKNFDDAFAAGTSALEQMNSAKYAMQLAEENNPDAVDSLKEQAQANQVAATSYFQQALELAKDDTDTDQLVTAQYYLCWLNWEAGNLEEAAVLGRSVASNHPEHKYAPMAAKLALASYERLYNAAKQANQPTESEAKELTDIAEMLVKNWPDSPEAATGLNLLINIALRNDRVADAEDLLIRLPSASRAAADLRLGGSFWTRYLKASSNKQIANNEETLALKSKAGQLLTSGFDSLKTKPQVTATEATGVLYYTQFLLAGGDAAQAVEVLEHETVGPLTLVTSHAPQVSQPALIQEIYKVALRTYLSIEPPQREKAQAMMAALEEVVGQQGDAEQKLISIYVSLGLQLQQQIEALSAAGQSEKANAVASSFEDLLSRITQRVGGVEDWKIQSWIAHTNLQLGQGLQGEEATRYYKQAADAYLSLLSKANTDPKFAPSPVAIIAARKRLADCMLAQQKYADAIQNYVAILKDKPNMLELQQATAAALQQWGTEQDDAQKLVESIRGAMPQANKKNLIWGWLRLAAIADQARRKAEKRATEDPTQAPRAEKYKDLFFEARYHSAQARFAAAKLAQGESRQKQLRTARQSMASMKSLYPDLGGPRWQGAYLKLIQEMEQEK